MNVRLLSKDMTIQTKYCGTMSATGGTFRAGRKRLPCRIGDGGRVRRRPRTPNKKSAINTASGYPGPAHRKLFHGGNACLVAAENFNSYGTSNTS